ncbi:MAG: acyl carrier protein [Deltaproteobacteria bacterium]|nr:MAG: acyl carrier protein [Deltaproteobacteria bacterium]TMQ10472.1 MAG: acyl carrier protein [Deltaproteobacteria bacterium]
MTATASATFDALAGLIRETLSLGDVEIRADQLLFHDLDFTSLDLLDLLFRIEETLGVQVAEGTIYRLARGELPDEQFAEKGYLTAEGRARLMALLDDTPANFFPERIHVQTLPRYCTVGALVRLLDHLRGQAPGQQEPPA